MPCSTDTVPGGGTAESTFVFDIPPEFPTEVRSGETETLSFGTRCDDPNGCVETNYSISVDGSTVAAGTVTSEKTVSVGFRLDSIGQRTIRVTLGDQTRTLSTSVTSGSGDQQPGDGGIDRTTLLVGGGVVAAIGAAIAIGGGDN